MQIQTYVERLIDTSSSSSSLAFLRVLNLAHASTASLIEDLKQLDFFRANGAASATSPTTDRASMAGLSVLSGNLLVSNMAGAAAVSLVLDMALQELFTPYIDKYIDKEQKSLTELYASYLIKFTRWHRQNTKARGGTAAGAGQSGTGSMFDRMVNQITTAAQNSNAASAVQQEGARGLKHLMKLGGISLSDKQRRDSTDSLHSLSQSTGGAGDHQRNSSGTGTGTATPQAQAQPADMHIPLVVTEKDGEVSLEVAERMLRWHAEAVGRMIELSPPAEAYIGSLAESMLLRSQADTLAFLLAGRRTPLLCCGS